MRKLSERLGLVFFCAVFSGSLAARAQSLDRIGVTLLQSVTTNLNGSGIHVAQPEALRWQHDEL